MAIALYFLFLGFSISISGEAMKGHRNPSFLYSQANTNMLKIPLNSSLERQIKEESVQKLYRLTPLKGYMQRSKFASNGDLKKDLEVLNDAVEALTLVSEAIAIAEPELEPLAIAFEVFHAILSIFDKFVHEESPEMKYLRGEFKKLNQKIDDLMSQLHRAEDKIIEQEYLLVYKTNVVDRLQKINTSIWVFNQNTCQDTRLRLIRTFENTDYDPIQILHYIWTDIIGSGVPTVDLVLQIKRATGFSQPALDTFIKMFKNNAVQALLYVQYRSAFNNLTHNEASKDFENAKKLLVELSKKLVEARYDLCKEIWSDFDGTRKPQAIEDINEIINHAYGDNEQTANKIADTLIEKYPFNYWMAVVYDPVVGWESHGWAWESLGENGYLYGAL